MFICQVLCTSIEGIYALQQGGPSAKISFNNNITYHTWQISALIVEILIGIWGCFGGVKGGLHLTWLYNANWLFTNLIIQK